MQTLGSCQAPLRCLNIKGCRLVTNVGLAALVNLNHLTHLSLQASIYLQQNWQPSYLEVVLWMHDTHKPDPDCCINWLQVLCLAALNPVSCGSGMLWVAPQVAVHAVVTRLS